MFLNLFPTREKYTSILFNARTVRKVPFLYLVQIQAAVLRDLLYIYILAVTCFFCVLCFDLITGWQAKKTEQLDECDMILLLLQSEDLTSTCRTRFGTSFFQIQMSEEKLYYLNGT